MPRASHIAAASTATDPTQRLRECLRGTIGGSLNAALEDTKAINRVIDDYVDRTGDRNILVLDALGDIEAGEAGLDPESRDIAWHGPVADIVERTRCATRDLLAWFDKTIPLVGCSAEPGHGLSVPLYGENGSPAFTAIEGRTGVNRGNVDDFEEIEGQGAWYILLPGNQRPRVGVGDLWHQAFLWDGAVYGGTAREVWDKLEPVREDIRARAPLSLFDLGVQVGPAEMRETASNALAFLEASHGCDRADDWREGVLRWRIRDELEALLAEGSSLPSVGLTGSSDRKTVTIPEEVLGRVESDPEAALHAALTPLAEALHVKLAFRFGDSRPDGPDGP